MTKPRLLDLFCGAGGATRGYQLAGFDVTGVDITPQPRYVGEAFVQGDALEYCTEHGHEFDAIHASPPCQAYSSLRALHPEIEHPDLVAETRNALLATDCLWIIENVVGAPLVSPITLCGLMFGLRVYRHRLFESSLLLLQPTHIKHTERINTSGTGKNLGYYTGEIGAMVTVAGHLFSRAVGSAAMHIDWMTRDELAQAIPPAYTEFLGRQLVRALGVYDEAAA